MLHRQIKTDLKLFQSKVLTKLQVKVAQKETQTNYMGSESLQRLEN